MSISVNKSFEYLSHSLRVLAESYMDCFVFYKIDIDLDEYIFNLELAFKNTLESYHRLYDQCSKNENINFKWHNAVETSTILALRNANHHHNIRTLYQYHMENFNPSDNKKYTTVNFNNVDGPYMNIYISWLDFRNFLNAPKSISRLSSDTTSKIKTYLNASSFEFLAFVNGIQLENLFIDVIPLINNSLIKIVSCINEYLNPKSLESDLFYKIFYNQDMYKLENYFLEEINFSLS